MPTMPGLIVGKPGPELGREVPGTLPCVLLLSEELRRVSGGGGGKTVQCWEVALHPKQPTKDKGTFPVIRQLGAMPPCGMPSGRGRISGENLLAITQTSSSSFLSTRSIYMFEMQSGLKSNFKICYLFCIFI